MWLPLIDAIIAPIRRFVRGRPVFLLVFLFTPRVAIRLYWERKPRAATKSHSSGVLIYGAGRIGTVLSNLIHGRESRMKVYGFIDDAPALRGRRIYGHEVLGRESDIQTIHAVHKFDELWVTFPPDQIKRKRLQSFCEKENVKMNKQGQLPIYFTPPPSTSRSTN